MVKIDDKQVFDGFVSDVCSFCKHWNYFEKSCKAFDEIPDEIWEGKHKHVKPFDGDNGIRFEPKE